jgi:hypothetical protein
VAEGTQEDEGARARRQPASRRRGRSRATLVLVTLLAVITGTAVWLGQRDGTHDPVVTEPAPLLPGAPGLTTPTKPPPASVPPIGWDVSHPQCQRTLPDSGGFAIVGVTGGRPFTSNPCFAEQHAWAASKAGHAVYVNTGYPGRGDPVAYGRSVVDDAVARERTAGVSGTSMWWLDVETVNTWDGTAQQNATVLDAMAARLQGLGARVGIYSTPRMWSEIAGTWAPGLPVWYATGPGTGTQAAQACSRSFAGSTPAISQWVHEVAGHDIDRNLICPAFRNRAAEILDLG